jgi:DNA polymerase III subunit epsilon
MLVPMRSTPRETNETILQQRALKHLPVLIVDCQTTGANPERGHLLEVGWCTVTAARSGVDDREIAAHLVRLPPGVAVPGPISRLTGIGAQDLARADERAEVWQRLRSAAGAVDPGHPVVWAVAHVARFEEQFLRDLHAACDPGTEFPLRFLCTHEIARRLLPDLPRRGLRAVAGYFGFRCPELKRSTAHVAAQVAIWAALVDWLERERGVTRLADLQSMLQIKAPARRGAWSYPLPRERRLALPDQPGVYRFLGGAGDVLYVGKAGSLRKRVNSYYRKRRAEDKLLELVSQARDVAVTVTATALEAALLEVTEIKRCDPPYNRALRDRGQRVWFFSDDLRSSRVVADRRHRVGPIPVREAVAALPALAGCLTGHRAPSAARALNLDPRRVEPGPLEEALLLFRERFTADVGGTWTARRLMRLGAALLSGRAAARMRGREATLDAPSEEVDRGPEDEDRGEDRPSRAPWSADELVALLEESLVHAARLRSRGRWLTLLSESVIRWQPACASAAGGRWLSIEGGLPGPGCGESEAEPPPVPAGASTPVHVRRKRVDRHVYDRLRVLTSELHRLAASGRAVEVVLDRGKRLERERLLSVLERL